MTDCDRALALISAKVDGELAGGEAAWLEEHLARCPECRALLADFEAMHQLLPELAAEPPAELKEHIMEAVHASKTTPFHRTQRQWRWRSWASLAAVLALVIVGSGAVRMITPGIAGVAPALQAPAGADATGAAVREIPAAEQEKSGDAGLSLSPFAASAPEDSPAQAPSAKDAAPTGTPLTEDGAADALLDWLGQPDARLEPLGLSEDGTAWRFQLDDESVCAVPLDGSPIYRETP